MSWLYSIVVHSLSLAPWLGWQPDRLRHRLRLRLRLRPPNERSVAPDRRPITPIVIVQIVMVQREHAFVLETRSDRKAMLLATADRLSLQIAAAHIILRNLAQLTLKDGAPSGSARLIGRASVHPS